MCYTVSISATQAKQTHKPMLAILISYCIVLHCIWIMNESKQWNVIKWKEINIKAVVDYWVIYFTVAGNEDKFDSILF